MHAFNQNNNNDNNETPTSNKEGNTSIVLNPAMVTNKKQLLDKDSCEWSMCLLDTPLPQ